MNMTFKLPLIPRASMLCAALLLSLTAGCSRKPQVVTLSPTSGVIAVGLSQQFTPTGYFANGKVLPLSGAQWTVSKPDVITVTGSGMVTAHTAGQAMLIATVDGFTVQAPITVTPLAVQSISLSPPSATIPLGNTLTLIPTVHYTDNRSVTLKEGAQAPAIEYHTLWHSDNDAVASVDENGVVTVHQASGSATISMGLGNVMGAVKVSAVPAMINKVFINAPTHGQPDGDSGHVQLRRGATLQLHAMGTNSMDITSELNTAQTQLTWLSDDPSIITISPTGLVTAVAEGETRITLSAGGMETAQGVIVGN